VVALRQAGRGREAGTSRHVKRAKSSGRQRVAALGNGRGRRCRGPTCRFARPRPHYVASGWAAGLVSQAGPSLLPSPRLCRACWFKLCKSLWEWGPFGSSRRSRSRRSSGSEKKKQQQQGPWVSLVLYAQATEAGQATRGDHEIQSYKRAAKARGHHMDATCWSYYLRTHSTPPPMPFSFISFPGARFSFTFISFLQLACCIKNKWLSSCAANQIPCFSVPTTKSANRR
jgi:hypothetical protein